MNCLEKAAELEQEKLNRLFDAIEKILSLLKYELPYDLGSQARMESFHRWTEELEDAFSSYKRSLTK